MTIRDRNIAAFEEYERNVQKLKEKYGPQEGVLDGPWEKELKALDKKLREEIMKNEN